MKKIAIIGIGRMGTFHARTIQNHPDCKLMGFYDISEVAMIKALFEFHNAIEFKTIEDIGIECDAVVLATPASTHHELLKRLSKTDLHILCEKPVVDSFSIYEDVLSNFIDLKQKVNIGHSERFNPVIIELKPILKQSGSHFPATFVRKSMSDNNKDVSCIMDTMIHDIDLACYLFPNAGVPEAAFVKSFTVDGYHVSFVHVVVRFKTFTWEFTTDKNWDGPRIRTIHYRTTTREIEVDLIEKTIGGNRLMGHYPKDPLTLQLDAFIDSMYGKPNNGVSLSKAFKTMYIAGMIESEIKRIINLNPIK